MDMAQIEDLERRFLTPSQLDAKYGAGAAPTIVPELAQDASASPAARRRA